MTHFKVACKIFLLMTLLTGLVYPVVVTLIAQLAMPQLASGSLIKQTDQVVGSSLIAQKPVKEGYFWPRPSAIGYDPIKPSGGSSLGPTSQKLREEVEGRKKILGDQAPVDLLYASGSGLDPHISLDAAYFQAAKIAKQGVHSEEELRTLIDSHVEGQQLGFLGPRYVNVLLLNRALDERHERRE